MRILLTGKNGQVGFELERSLQPLGNIVAVDRRSMDFANLDQVRDVVREVRPHLIVNAAAYTAVDKAENETALAMRINGEAPGVMAEEAKRIGATIIHYSTDYVFDGKKQRTYTEDDEPNPINEYGRSKLAGERAIQAVGVPHIILRTSWVYGRHGKNFPKTILRLAQQKTGLTVVSDQQGTPNSAEMIADVTALVLHRLQPTPASLMSCTGIYHLTSTGETTWYDYACELLGYATEAGVSLRTNRKDVIPVLSEAYPQIAKRPKNSCMNPKKFEHTFQLQLPDWRFSLRRTIKSLS